MNLTGDESLEARLIGVLRRRAHVVLSIHEEFPGLTDREVLELSVARGAPVVTNDRDFGDLVFRRLLPCVGVIFLRFPGLDTLEKADILASWLDENAHLVEGHYVVLGARGARVRPLPAIASSR